MQQHHLQHDDGSISVGTHPNSSAGITTTTVTDEITDSTGRIPLATSEVAFDTNGICAEIGESTVAEGITTPANAAHLTLTGAVSLIPPHPQLTEPEHPTSPDANSDVIPDVASTNPEHPTSLDSNSDVKPDVASANSLDSNSDVKPDVASANKSNPDSAVSLLLALQG